MRSRPRVLLAKPGLDGHDKGIRLVAMALRDAGVEVIYLGLRNSLQDIVDAAVDENPDIIGLSILSGAQLSIVKKITALKRAAGVADIPLLVGGTIPPQDVDALRMLGAAEVFPVGSRFDAIVEWVYQYCREQNDNT